MEAAGARWDGLPEGRRGSISGRGRTRGGTHSLLDASEWADARDALSRYSEQVQVESDRLAGLC